MTKAEARSQGIAVGIAMSVAYVIREHGEDGIALNWWDEAGLTIEQCEKLGVDEYDLGPIRKALEAFENDRKA